MKTIYYPLFLIFTFVFSVHGQTKILSFKFNHNAAGSPMELNKTIFTIQNGKKVKLTRAEFYLSNVSLFSNSQDSFNIADSYLLINANKPNAVHLVGSYPENFEFNKIKMFVGIDKDKNHADPNLYPASHPLGPKSPDMHWGWAAGYRFIALEGLVDNNNDGVPEQEFQIHSLGDDLLFRTLMDMSMSHHIENEGMSINLDYVKLFNNITMSGNLIQHGSGALNKNVLKNAANSGFIVPIIIASTENGTFDDIATIQQSNNSLSFKFGTSDQRSIEMSNIIGQVIYKSNNDVDYLNLDISNIVSGNYFISITTGNKTFTRQIFIQ